MAEWNAQKPLSGVVVCCTNIVTEQRHNLASIAAEMGASHRYDLTADVTHLVVGSIESPKYKFVAKERPDVKVVQPSWIEAVRQLWMGGHECTEAEIISLEDRHKTPTLWGLQICLTGFDETDRRDEIKSIVERGGATYHPDLTKGVSHLVTRIAHGKKYEAARKWAIPCVSEKWLADSFERGLALDEQLYDPTIPPERQGVGAWRKDLANLENGARKKRKLENQSASNIEGKRKLRRTMSQRLKSNSESLWADIGTGAAPKATADAFTEAADESVIVPASEAAPIRKPHEAPPVAVEAVQPQKSGPQRKEGIFTGVAVYIHGFTVGREQILSQHLSANGAVVPSTWTDDNIVNGFEIDVKILMVPHDLPESQWPSMMPQLRGLPKVTEFWVESCLHQKSTVDPETDRFTQPFKHQRIPGHEALIMVCSGFKDMELLHLSKTIKMTGATFDEYLGPDSDLLICQSSSIPTDKLKYAWELGIPVVGLGWMWKCLENGISHPYDEFLIKPPAGFKIDKKRLLQGKGVKISRARSVQRSDRSDPTSVQPLSDQRDDSIILPVAKAANPNPRPLQDLPREQLNKPSASPPKLAKTNIARARMPFADDDETASENSDPSQQQHHEPIGEAQAAELLNLLEVPNMDGANARSRLRAMEPPPKSREASAAAVRTTELTSSIENLLAAKQASAIRRPSTGDSNHSLTKDRRKRGLGRAASGNSVTSSAMSNTADREPAKSSRLPMIDDESQSFSQRWYAEHAGADSYQEKDIPNSHEPPATQGLVYGDEESRERKEAMLRMIAGETAEAPSPKRTRRSEVTVRDVLPQTTAGIGERVGGRKGKSRRA